MKIRTAIFGVYVAASAVGFAVLMVLVLRDVRLRYVESMRRTLGDTAVFLAAFVAPQATGNGGWARKLKALPANEEGLGLRVFACDREGRVVFDAAQGRDVGTVYTFPMRGGGAVASENYTVSNVAEVGGELRVAAPVRRGGELIGWVGVGRPLATVAEGVSRARWELIWSLGSIAAVMVALGWWISTRLTHALERLTTYAQAVRAGKPALPPQSKAAEIAALGRAFEEMRVALEGKAHVEHYTQALAHEFKAPLSAIRGAAELLAENPPEADRVRFVANLRAETERLQRIVERLFELAALEAKRAGAALAEVDVSAVVAKVCEDARSAAEMKRVTLTLTRRCGAAAVAGTVAGADTSAGAGARVRGDAVLLEQAIGNLVQNALEFTPSGGAVDVVVEIKAGREETACGDADERDACGRRVRVAVEDSGPGVPDYAVEKVFERFYSLPRPDTGRKSSGMGLSIVREIARLHRGEATLENRAKSGARAVLTLPMA